MIKSLFEQLKRGLQKTRQQLGFSLGDIFKGNELTEEVLEELETLLLSADVGVDTTAYLIKELNKRVKENKNESINSIFEALLVELLEPVEVPLNVATDQPFVILMVGVNGAGKTTTIGKLSRKLQQEGKKVMLAAGDTFRAAATEQLVEWGKRNDIPVIAQHEGADSASVIYDAIQAAKARKFDVVIADTAGRLQNKSHLMGELEKIVRVMKKESANAPHEVLLVLDGTTGQNALSQVKLFNEAVQVTGITISKLDGTAKGGVLLAVAKQYGIPIRFIGVGESVESLQTFEAKSFVKALCGESGN